ANQLAQQAAQQGQTAQQTAEQAEQAKREERQRQQAAQDAKDRANAAEDKRRIATLARDDIPAGEAVEKGGVGQGYAKGEEQGGKVLAAARAAKAKGGTSQPTGPAPRPAECEQGPNLLRVLSDMGPAAVADAMLSALVSTVQRGLAEETLAAFC